MELAREQRGVIGCGLTCRRCPRPDTFAYTNMNTSIIFKPNLWSAAHFTATLRPHPVMELSLMGMFNKNKIKLWHQQNPKNKFVSIFFIRVFIKYIDHISISWNCSTYCRLILIFQLKIWLALSNLYKMYRWFKNKSAISEQYWKEAYIQNHNKYSWNYLQT